MLYTKLPDINKTVDSMLIKTVYIVSKILVKKTIFFKLLLQQNIVDQHVVFSSLHWFSLKNNLQYSNGTIFLNKIQINLLLFY